MVMDGGPSPDNWQIYQVADDPTVNCPKRNIRRYGAYIRYLSNRQLYYSVSPHFPIRDGDFPLTDVLRQIRIRVF